MKENKTNIFIFLVKYNVSNSEIAKYREYRTQRLVVEIEWMESRKKYYPIGRKDIDGNNKLCNNYHYVIRIVYFS